MIVEHVTERPLAYFQSVDKYIDMTQGIVFRRRKWWELFKPYLVPDGRIEILNSKDDYIKCIEEREGMIN